MKKVIPIPWSQFHRKLSKRLLQRIEEPTSWLWLALNDGESEVAMSIDFEGMYRQARAEATDVSEHLLHYLDTIKSPLWRIHLLALLSPRSEQNTRKR
jgi:hypothetical protein